LGSGLADRSLGHVGPGFGIHFFAESLGQIIVNPAYRAGTAAVALIGVTAIVIYRERLLEKFKDPSGGLIVGVISIGLLVLALSPFVEEKRWPFSAWFAAPRSEELENLRSQLTTLAQERDQARQQFATAQARIQTLEARTNTSRPQPPPAPYDQGPTDPIRWEQLGFGFQGGPEPMFIDIEVLAEITGTLPVEIKDAYIMSGTTGEKLPMMLDTGKEGKILPRDANPIPNGMRFYLTAMLSPPLSGLQLLSEWGKVLLFVEYDGKKYERTFDEEYMRNQLSRYPGSGLGPRITKKQDAKGK
jgi:hypothetical protein